MAEGTPYHAHSAHGRHKQRPGWMRTHEKGAFIIAFRCRLPSADAPLLIENIHKMESAALQQNHGLITRLEALAGNKNNVNILFSGRINAIIKRRIDRFERIVAKSGRRFARIVSFDAINNTNKRTASITHKRRATRVCLDSSAVGSKRECRNATDIYGGSGSIVHQYGICHNIAWLYSKIKVSIGAYSRTYIAIVAPISNECITYCIIRKFNCCAHSRQARSQYLLINS